jgi:sulfur carrier protein ThiS
VVVISPTGVSCSSNVTVVSSPTQPPRTITTGVTVHGTLSSCNLADEFNVVVASNGTLVVRLSWDTTQTSTISLVTINGVAFRSGPPDWAPVVAKVTATQGQLYLLRVALEGSKEIPEDRYQLTTALE